MNIIGINPTVSMQGDIGIKMLSKQLDANKEQGEALVEMIDKSAMERSVNPFVGSNFDMSV